MNLRSRRITTAAQKLPDNHKELLDLWRHQIACFIADKEIPEELVVNADQTGVS